MRSVGAQGVYSVAKPQIPNHQNPKTPYPKLYTINPLKPSWPVVQDPWPAVANGEAVVGAILVGVLRFKASGVEVVF